MNNKNINTSKELLYFCQEQYNSAHLRTSYCLSIPLSSKSSVTWDPSGDISASIIIALVINSEVVVVIGAGACTTAVIEVTAGAGELEVRGRSCENWSCSWFGVLEVEVGPRPCTWPYCCWVNCGWGECSSRRYLWEDTCGWLQPPSNRWPYRWGMNCCCCPHWGGMNGWCWPYCWKGSCWTCRGRDWCCWPYCWKGCSWADGCSFNAWYTIVIILLCSSVTLSRGSSLIVVSKCWQKLLITSQREPELAAAEAMLLFSLKYVLICMKENRNITL